MRPFFCGANGLEFPLHVVDQHDAEAVRVLGLRALVRSGKKKALHSPCQPT